MAEMSVNKGTGVAQIQGPAKHSNGHARRQPSRQPKDGQEQDEEREGFEEFLVEIGEEARRNAEPGQGPDAEAGAGQGAQGAPGGEETTPQGAKKIDVVI